MINLVLRLLVFSLGLDTKPSSIPAVDGIIKIELTHSVTHSCDT